MSEKEPTLREEIFEMMDNSVHNSGLEQAMRPAREIAAELVEQGGMPESLADDHDVDDETEYEEALDKIEPHVREWQEITR